MKSLPHNKELTLEYFHSLVAIALADGILKPEEEEFFKAKAEEFGFEMQSVEDMFQQSIEELVGQINYDADDVDFVTDLVAMSMVDGELHEKEYELCIKLVEKKGFSKADVDNTIQWLQKLMNQKD
jgi:uncharacterized tellurite resistance protein B-like protein